MAVENKRAATLPDLKAAKPGHADARISHGVLRTSTHGVEIGNGDSAGSTYEVARIPSHARLHRTSVIRNTAIAAGTATATVDFGNAENAGGGNKIGAAISLAAAGDKDAINAIAIGDLGKPIWQLLGYNRDPKKEIPLYLTLSVATTSAGTAVADLVYIVE